jgi:hypothetical protein
LPDGIFSCQKIPTLVHFGAPWNGPYWYSLWSFGILWGDLVNFLAICFVSRFGFTKKNMATLIPAHVFISFEMTVESIFRNKRK